jgi:hypothetical protein
MAAMVMLVVLLMLMLLAVIHPHARPLGIQIEDVLLPTLALGRMLLAFSPGNCRIITRNFE